HGLTGLGPRLPAAFLEDLPDTVPLAHKPGSSLLKRSQHRLQMRDEGLLAFDAPDSCPPAFHVDSIDRGASRECLVKVKDGADLGIARIAAPLAGRVGHHR